VQVADPPVQTPPAGKSAATLALAATGAPPAAEPIVLSAVELTRRLSSVDEDSSVRKATDVVLAAWGERPLVVDESRLPDDLPSVAWRRGLQELMLTSNRSMLRLLDLPALLALRIPGAKGVRYGAVTGMDPGRVALSIDGQ